MTDTLFVPKTTVVAAAWIQPINDAVYRGVDPNYQTLGGLVNAYTFAFPSGSLITALTAGMVIRTNVNITNTGATTLVVTGATALGSVAITNKGGALIGGELMTGSVIELIFDGTGFQIVGGTVRFAPTETPAGTQNGVNTSFTLVHSPKTGYLSLHSNGSLLQSGAGNDYTIVGNAITMATAPLATDILLAAPYQY